MLQELHLRGLGVVGEASVVLAPGLNVVTGETGVGKTLLVTSLALLTGARGNAKLVSGDEAVVQAVIEPPREASEALRALGLPDDDELVLVRRMTADGRSRAWAGGQLVPVSVLAEIGEVMVEMHGQGAGFALARPATQLAAIDALARNEDLLTSYRQKLAKMRELERQLAALRESGSTREREIDVLSFQADEIERAALEPDEDDRVAAALTKLEHGERLAGIGDAVMTLAGADGAAGDLAEAHKTLQSAIALDPEVEMLVRRLGDVAAEVAELSREIRAWTETLEADPRQLEELRERKALIQTLKRKYAGSVEDIVAIAASARARLEELEGTDTRIAKAEVDLATARAEADAAARDLTKRRRKAAKELAKLVAAELPALALPQAVFCVDHSEGDLTNDGADRIEFRFSSSRATLPEPIGKVASGGELSRAMIAVTLALASSHHVGVLVFDEADQGVGGEAALELGRRLARLGRSHQVLVVSHLPQIAAFADRHIAVRRSGDDVSIEVLDDDQRLAEVSRMLAGLERSDRARAHAAELLDLAAAERSAPVPGG